jgi:hypothetical protein
MLKTNKLHEDAGIQRYNRRKKSPLLAEVSESGGDQKTSIQLLFASSFIFSSFSSFVWINYVDQGEQDLSFHHGALGHPSVMITIFSSASERDKISCGQPYTKTLNPDLPLLIVPEDNILITLPGDVIHLQHTISR